MNIFILHPDQSLCAKYHCDKHIVKMPLETTQKLCSVQWRYNSTAPYLKVHTKHPCTLWAGDTVDNYKWLWEFGIELCKEYTYRYERTHACEKVLAIIKNPPVELTKKGTTLFPQAMPEEYKHRDPVVAYREYYKHEKRRFAKWKKRKTPPFMVQM